MSAQVSHTIYIFWVQPSLKYLNAYFFRVFINSMRKLDLVPQFKRNVKVNMSMVL